MNLSNEKKRNLKAGIDLHKSQSVIYMLDEKKQKVASKRIATRFEEFSKFFKPYLKDSNIQVAVEVGNCCFHVCRNLEYIGTDTYIVNTLLNKAISQSFKKTDKKDAITLAKQLSAGFLPEPVYLPSKDMQDLRGLVQHRCQLVKETNRTANRAHALLTNNGILVGKSALRKNKKYWENIQMEKLPEDDVILRKRFKYLKEQFELHNRQLKELDSYQDEQIAKHYGQESELLQTIPGVGPCVAGAALSYGGDGSRFKNTRKYQSYWGVVPGCRQSAGKNLSGSGKVTKMGPSILRGYLMQGALSILRYKNKEENKPLVEFYEKIRKRKGWKKARAALVRKLLSIMYGVLKHKKAYDASYLVKASMKGDADMPQEPVNQSGSVSKSN